MTEEPEETTEDSAVDPSEFSYVYILGSDGPGGMRSYVGWTVDLDRRLCAHNSGKGARSTRGRLWCLLYAEQYRTRTEAQSREWHLKKDRNFRRNVLLSMGRSRIDPR